MFYRRASLEQWLLLDENPNVITFCERPGYVLIHVRYVDRDELVVLSESLFLDPMQTSHVSGPLAPLGSALSYQLSSLRRVRRRTTGNASFPACLPYCKPGPCADIVATGDHAICEGAAANARYRARVPDQ